MTKNDYSRVLEAAAAGRQAASVLAALSTRQKKAALLAAADSLERSRDEILQGNRQDVCAAEKVLREHSAHDTATAAKLAPAGRRLSPALVSRLKLDDLKLSTVIEGVRQVAAQEDPVGHVTLARELDDGLELYRVTCPIGLIAIIFESRPDALPQISSLCLMSGNAAILKGGTEALQTNKLLFQAIHQGITAAGLPANALMLLETREAIEAVLQADRYVDLIIPRGSAGLVRYIQSNTRIPVLGHADGLCQLYVDRSADLEAAVKITIDSKTQYPAACNSIETLLVHEAIAPEFLEKVIPLLIAAGVQLRCDPKIIGAVPDQLRSRVVTAQPEDWSTEYCDLVLSVKAVDDIDEAISHINRYGSHHTDAIVAADKSAFDRFFLQVDSAGVYWNASTRFADGFRYGFGAEVGISTGKLHPRGPVGLDGLVTYKYKLVGKGQVVADYVGERARRFTHRPL